MRHSGVILKVSEGFYSLLSLYAIILPWLSANSASFFTLSLWPLNGIFWIKQFHGIYNGSENLPSFLNTSLVSSIFSLCVKRNTFLIRIFLPLYHSFIQWWFAPPLTLKISKKFCFCHQFRKKAMKQIVYETTTNLVRGWKTTTSFIRQWF